MSIRQYSIINKFCDLESCWDAGYTGAKFEVRGYDSNTTCKFDVEVHRELVIKHPITAKFENVSNYILLKIEEKRRKFLINSILVYKSTRGGPAYMLSIPPFLSQSPSETLELMKQELCTLLVMNETTDSELRTLERQVQHTHRLEASQNALLHAKSIIARHVPKVCPHCLREEARVPCLRCGKLSLCSSCFVRTVQCYLCNIY